MAFPAACASLLVPRAGSSRASVRRRVAAVPVGLLRSVVAVVATFTVARAIYYPWWALRAPRPALERSWGGPTPVGAILGHWLVAAAILVPASIVLVRLSGMPGSDDA